MLESDVCLCVLMLLCFDGLFVSRFVKMVELRSCNGLAY